MSPTNVGRQSFWANDIGQYKAETLIRRFNAFGGTSWQYINEYATSDVLTYNYCSGTDLIITCVDKATFRAELGKEMKPYHSDVLWLDAGNSESGSQVILGHVASPSEGMKLPNVFDLYPSLDEMEDVETDSCSHEEALSRQTFGINIDTASACRNIIWQMLRFAKIEHHGVFTDLTTAQADPLMIDPMIWSSFGYQEGKEKETLN